MNFDRNRDRKCGNENGREDDTRGYAPDPISHSGTSRIPFRDESGAKTGPLLATCAETDSKLRCNVYCDIIGIYE